MKKSAILFSILITFIIGCGDDADDTEQLNGSRIEVRADAEDQCPNGGVKIEMGIDENGNGTLDAEEIDKTEYVCNGSDGSKGTKGDAGDQGPKGDKGDQGDQGLKGDKGDPGEKGDQGDPGTDGATWTEGNGAPDDANGKDGDFYLDRDTNDIYKKESGSWTKIGNLNGDKGDQGDAGTDGTNGTDGATWTEGSGVPDNASGKDGDLYLDRDTSDIYKKESGSWSKIGNLKGDKGDQGDTGNSGVDAACAGNNAPVINNVSIASTVFVKDTEIKMTVDASDADDDTLTYSVTGSGASIRKGEIEGEYFLTFLNPGGPFMFTIVVSDECQMALDTFTVDEIAAPLPLTFADPNFNDPSAWTMDSGVAVNAFSAGNKDMGEAVFDAKVLCSNPTISQKLNIPAQDQTGALSLKASMKGFDDSNSENTIGIRFGESAVLPLEINEANLDAYADLTICLGETAHNGEQTVAFLPAAESGYSTECDYDNLYLDNVEISADTNCPLIGQIPNSDFTNGLTSWEQVSASNTTVEIIDVAGEKQLHFLATGGFCSSAKLKNVASVPLEATLANTAIKFDFKSDTRRLSLELENGLGRIFQWIEPSADFTTATVCIPEELKGTAPDMYLGIDGSGGCAFVPEGHAFIKNFRIETDASCAP